MSKWTRRLHKDGNNYIIHYVPQRMADDLYCANLVIAHHKPDQVVEFKVALKEATLFNSEEDAAELGLKAGLEWVRDNG